MSGGRSALASASTTGGSIPPLCLTWLLCAFASGKGLANLCLAMVSCMVQRKVLRKEAGATWFAENLVSTLGWLWFSAFVWHKLTGVAGCLAYANNPRLDTFGLWPFVPATNVPNKTASLVSLSGSK